MPALHLDQFDNYLPKEVVAHQPLPRRDESRLLVLDRHSGRISHHHFYDLPSLLQTGDVIVRNNTKVIPARILGHKTTGGMTEILLTKRLRGAGTTGEVWECLTKPGLKPGQVVVFLPSNLTATCITVTGFTREITFSAAGHQLFNYLYEIGHTPIPPYIPAWDDVDEPRLRQVYQTTYAKLEGSAAAPTAGLHFTPELDGQLRAVGVQIEEVTLHVGLGTFLRVKEQDITKHHMHAERFEMTAAVANRLNQAKREQRRLLAVGTTTTRVLETIVQQRTHQTPAAKITEPFFPTAGETSLYVYPPYRFSAVDAMITNFHEPRSTLLMLVSAFVSAPNTGHAFSNFQTSTIGQAYQTAIDNHYRLLSFGDAMMIM